MSYKVGLILSMVFVSLCFLFGVDLISIKSVYSSLDAKATNISYLISQSGIVNQGLKKKIQRAYSVTFDCPIVTSSYLGKEITFTISTKYKPLVISKKEMEISITRIAVVGFYG